MSAATSLNVVSETAREEITSLPCPLCGSTEGTIKLHVLDPDTHECSECGDEFDVKEYRALADKLNRYLAYHEAIKAAEREFMGAK